MSRNMAIAALAGFVAAFAWRGWTAAIGFALGAAAAALNFRWLRRFVAGLGPAASGSKKGGLFAFFFALRYLLLAAGAYAILRYSKLSLPAALLGLFVPLAAAIVEVFTQLRYERRDLDH